MRTIKETIGLMLINGLIGGCIALASGAAVALLIYLTGDGVANIPINPFAIILVVLTLGFWWGVAVMVNYLDRKDHGRLPQSHRDEGR